MHDRHFRQRVRHDQRNARSQQIRKNDGGPGETDGYAASQKQPDADRTADGHHRELPLAQAALQTVNFRHRKLFNRRRGHIPAFVDQS